MQILNIGFKDNMMSLKCNSLSTPLSASGRFILPRNYSALVAPPARTKCVIVHATAAHPAPDKPEAAPSDAGSIWGQFAAHASGEWEGVNVAFDAAGKPQPLPEYYVPSAYRDWGVELYDW